MEKMPETVDEYMTGAMFSLYGEMEKKLQQKRQTLDNAMKVCDAYRKTYGAMERALREMKNV